MPSMMPVDNMNDIIVNLHVFNDYRKSEDDLERDFFIGILKRGKHFVYLRAGEEIFFCPSRFVGYKKNNKKKHEASREKHGGETDRAINVLLGKHTKNAEIEKVFLSFCRSLGVSPDRKERKYWLIEESAGLAETASIYDKGYKEGLVKGVLQDAYERNPKARAECIKIYGKNCMICNMNFQSVYGDIGENFIHVHHLTPLSRQGGKSCRTNPKKDLRPVCPNCHAMLHQEQPPLTIQELKRKMTLRK